MYHYLLQQKRVFQDPLDGLDQVGLQGGRVLLPSVAGLEELLKSLVLVTW